ncbi:hypothetical protein OE88DRAFT_38552 [Heliocybe sulcata]|uniref:PEHE domain-containing protein n=1 Tax=Heliocybe sulcata TaxID=5364 RepID=A0A5C3NIG9_9AGAM|nr:hypothetical protein OE88DRAFT_38552 [Heliocybe sulcata]
MTMSNNISGKRAGKQRAQDVTPSTSAADTSANGPASVAKDRGTPNTRQKRVLPSRSRRGGPGIGSCDVDVMILEAHRRKFENEPLIPADTRFFLTTNSSLIPSTSASSFEIELNSSAYERYFDRPEVIKAYREQQTIQTPEYTLLTEDASVGSRFRPRGSEDELADTLDAAYEKRHRKYETFEKRQRLREKEKLKHEQYKLKERIDQLRAMDAAAFLALPVSALSTPSDPVSAKQADEELPGGNGAAAHAEGERRRQEMLHIAKGLEERYNLLLPPDRRWMERGKNAARRKSASFSVEPELQPKPEAPVYEEEEEEEEEEKEEEAQQEDDKQELEISVTEEEAPDDDGESEIDVEERRAATRKSPEKIKLKIRLRPSVEIQSASIAGLKKLKSSSGLAMSPIRQIAGHTSFPLDPDFGSAISTHAHLSNKERGPDGRWLPYKIPKIQDENGEISHSAARRLSAQKSYTHSDIVRDAADGSIYASKKGERNSQCILLATAKRNAGEPNVRKTQRHLTAFGLKVPFEVEEFRDFELPPWLLPGYETEEEEEEEAEEEEEEEAEEVNGISNGMEIDRPATEDTRVGDADVVMDSAPAPEVAEVDVAFKGG